MYDWQSLEVVLHNDAQKRQESKPYTVSTSIETIQNSRQHHPYNINTSADHHNVFQHESYKWCDQRFIKRIMKHGAQSSSLCAIMLTRTCMRRSELQRTIVSRRVASRRVASHRVASHRVASYLIAFVWIHHLSGSIYRPKSAVAACGTNAARLFCLNADIREEMWGQATLSSYLFFFVLYRKGWWVERVIRGIKRSILRWEVGGIRLE